MKRRCGRSHARVRARWSRSAGRATLGRRIGVGLAKYVDSHIIDTQRIGSEAFGISRFGDFALRQRKAQMVGIPLRRSVDIIGDEVHVVEAVVLLATEYFDDFSVRAEQVHEMRAGHALGEGV